MYHWLVILLFSLGASLSERAGIAHTHNENGTHCEIYDLCREQIECCRHYNFDAERTASVVVPSARNSSTTSSRQAQQRFLHFVVAERFATTNYPTRYFIHRLGNYSRAVDYYLYLFCQLRL